MTTTSKFIPVMSKDFASKAKSGEVNGWADHSAWSYLELEPINIEIVFV